MLRRVPFAALVMSLGCAPSKPPPAIPPVAPSEPLELELGGAPAQASASKTVATPRRKCPAAQVELPANPDFSIARAMIDDLLGLQGAPSVAVAVGHAGEMVWSEGFGWADRRRRQKATPDTMYSLASISKPFTATAIMVLSERELIDLDAPIGTYLGEVGVRAGVGDPAEATVARVADHTAGLPLHYRFFYGDERPPEPEVTRARHAILVSEPGERMQYSNLGYGLLEHVIANVSGKSYAAFMHEEIFEPLGLRHMSVGRPRPTGGKRVATRYDGRGEPIPDYGFDHDGASALYGSAHDLVAFGMTHLGFVRPDVEPLLRPEAIARMREVRRPAKDYGLGWAVRRSDGQLTISHSGGMPGVSTMLVLFPAHALVVAVLVNRDGLGSAPAFLAGIIARAAGLPARSDALCALPPTHPVLGRWEGTLDLAGQSMALVLEVEHDGRVSAIVGEETVELFGVSFGKGGLEGRALGELTASGRIRDLRFNLQLRGDERLAGSLSIVLPSISATTGFVDLRRSVPLEP